MPNVLLKKFSIIFCYDQFLGLTEFLNSTEIEECDDEPSGRNTFNKIFMDTYLMNKEKWLQHCPLPCKQKVFDFDYQMHHKNNILQLTDTAPGLNFIKHFILKTETGIK
jgi:hypothetical protein